jgi:hypothetical protein
MLAVRILAVWEKLTLSSIIVFELKVKVVPSA